MVLTELETSFSPGHHQILLLNPSALQRCTDHFLKKLSTYFSIVEIKYR